MSDGHCVPLAVNTEQHPLWLLGVSGQSLCQPVTVELCIFPLHLLLLLSETQVSVDEHQF